MDLEVTGGPNATKGVRLNCFPIDADVPLKLLDEDLSLNEVARRVHCAASSVMRWRNDWRRRGADLPPGGLLSGSSEKAHAKTQERRLLRILLQGAIASGYRTELWTTKAGGGGDSKNLSCAVAISIPLAYTSIGLGGPHQKPEQRALERGRKGHRALEAERLAASKKKRPRGWGAHLVFCGRIGAFCWLPWWPRLGHPGAALPFQRHRQGRRDKNLGHFRNFR